MSDLTDQQIYDRLGKIKGLPTCSQWAAGFADSIRQQMDKGRTLSDRQKVVLSQDSKENNKEAQKSLANWESEYNMHHKKKAMQLATYYHSQVGGYYGDVVKGILEARCPSVESTSRCATTSTPRRFLLSWSASLVWSR